MESIDHLFKECYFAIHIDYFNYNCTNRIDTNYDIVDWLEHVWSLRKSYYKPFDNLFG